MEKYGEGRKRKKAVFFPFRTAIVKGTIEPGRLARSASSAIFSSGINSSSILMTGAARIIHRDFSVRVHLSPGELLRKIDCAYASRRTTLEKDAAEKER